MELTKEHWKAFYRLARKGGHADRLVCMKGTDMLAEREHRARRIRELAEPARLPSWHPTRPDAVEPCVAMITNGMDCDCSAWSGRVTYIRAVPREVEKIVDDFYAGAEGPQGHYFLPPSAAVDVDHEERDLALEAFEDGHDHVIYYPF